MKAPLVEFFPTLCFFVVIKASLTAETQNVSSDFHQIDAFDLLQTAFFSFGSNKAQCSKSSEFRCRDGSCIDLALLCDGIPNCVDYSDEENCDFIKCRPPNFFKCYNQKCIQANLLCNGRIDCSNGEDEKHCETTVPLNHNCLNTTYKCANGGCVPLAWVCDGKNDCSDGSDEIFGCTSKRCEKNEFQCKNKSCIPLDFRCDALDDCGDNSDEENCDHHVLDMTNCTLNSGKYPCQDKLKCIDFANVCDDKIDCFDGSDEGGLCLNAGINPCPNCTHECHVTPSEAHCLCHKGYWLDQHNICQDINECETYGICDQKCINSPGSYSCACDPSYILQQDKKTCLVPSEHLAVLLYTSSAGVSGLFLHNLRNFTVKETLGPSIGISAANRDIYWTVLTEESQAIVKTSIDDYIPRMIATSGLGSPEDLDVDWITNNVYFTDSKFKHIGVCTNTGRVCTVLFNENIDKPRAISLSPENGLLFWSDWGKWPMIARSGMDGSDAHVFVKENIHWPNGISTDTPNSRLYWVDAKLQRIESIKFDGTDRRVILSDSVKHPFSISVFENKLYWSNFDGNEILECNKFTGKEKRSLIRDLNNHLYSIHVHHPVHNAQKVENPCAHSDCSDMCLLAPPSKNKNLSYSCACPDDKVLSSNMKSCSSKKYPKLFIAGLKNRIFIIEHQHLGHPEIKEMPLEINTISSMTYNSLKGEVIIVDSKPASIKSYNLQSGETTVISQEIYHVPSIHFDDFGNNLYWCDWETLTIMLMSLKTLAKTVFFQGIDYEFPIDLALVPEEGYMFVALHVVSSFNVVIDIIAMDGSLISRKRLIEISVDGAYIKLYFDREKKRLFWIDMTRGVIESVDLSGKDRITHAKVTEPFSSIYFDNMLFWTKKDSPNIFWQDITAVSSHQKHLKLPISEMKREDGVFLINPHNYHVKDSPCHLDNGGCSDICLATNKSSTTECACATGYILSVDGKHCQLPRNCETNEFRCFTGECIPFYKVCDKHKDCLHGDDEFVESCRYFVCPDEQFFCSAERRCIDKKLKCNGHADCKDGSDEMCEPCGKGKFKCNSGECIDVQFRCDGRVDCKHGYDEVNCHNVTCAEREFKCNSGQCIPAAWYCDGQFDCVDGTDEPENCAFRCRRGEFHCTNGACVDIYLTCDGKDDCGDGSDEDRECANNKNVYREDTFYYHKNHTGHVYKVCNSRTEFHCETTSGSHCIPKALRCDGVTNCLHGEDEKNCEKALECAHDNEFYCRTNGKCIPSEWLCDNHNDCGDNSDEDILQCLKKNITGTACSGFRCKNGGCISLADVCNNVPDCSDQSDEGGQCGNNCEKFGCSHKCHELPSGPKCSCPYGFTLGSDNKTCHDVDECQFDICSQNCTNIPGSFICSCFSSEYSLRSDHVSCKANGDTAHFVIASLTEMNIISNNWMRTSHVVNLPFGSMINAIDVDNRKSHIYTVWDFSSIRKIDALNSENLILNIPSVYGIAVDWITGNLYYNHDRTSINLVSFSKTVPAVIYDTYGRGQILSLAVDPVAGYLFWYETFGSGNNLDSGVIKRADCDGANVRSITLRMKIIVENIQVDSYEKNLYWYSKDMGVVIRMNYDGTSIKEVLHFEKNVAGFSFFENSIYWASANSDIYPIRKCKIYGLPPLKCEVIESRLKGVVFFTVMQESRQRNVSNPCSPNPCSDFCVPSPSGPKCLCYHEENQKSVSCHLQKAIKLDQSKTSFKTYFAYFVVVCLIVGVGFVGYYYYKPKSRIFHRFHFYSAPFDRSEKLYTSHASGINELVISKPENAFLEPVTEESENEYVMIGHKTSRESLIKNNF